MNEKFLCNLEQFQQALSTLEHDGYRLLGPTVRDKAIVLDQIHSWKDLPVGLTDEQDPGQYRIQQRKDNALFGYTVGPHSWKQFLFPPKERLYSSVEQNSTISFSEVPEPAIEKMAFIGVHPCDIQAIHVQDKVFHHSKDHYEQYMKRREQIFIMAVQCTTCTHTCFCVSMGTGPGATKGFDVALTEVLNGNEHHFIVEAGSDLGRALCSQLTLPKASEEQVNQAHALVEKNATQMTREVDNEHVHELLMKSWACKRWENVSSRCVNCTNCTMVCPTCFCSESIDVTEMNGCRSEHCQGWDSCFTLSHSYMHGGSIRQSALSRYRQWLTHKFGTWWNQFGLSGCVGCGRCITWCPVGIDVTEELRELHNEIDTTKG